jgi:hypothetical protein
MVLMPTIDQHAARVFGTQKPVEMLGMWVIYDHPTDYPDRYVARRFYSGPGVILASDDLLTGDTIEELRILLPHGLTRVPRSPQDDPKVLEAWV